MATYEKGSLGEPYPWSIERDETTQFCESTVCHHCTLLPPSENDRGRPRWTCPTVVVAHSQSRHDSTVVCLQCIIEAAKIEGLL